MVAFISFWHPFLTKLLLVVMTRKKTFAIPPISPGGYLVPQHEEKSGRLLWPLFLCLLGFVCSQLAHNSDDLCRADGQAKRSEDFHCEDSKKRSDSSQRQSHFFF